MALALGVLNTSRSRAVLSEYFSVNDAIPNPERNKNTKSRKRNIIWFNLPYSMNAQTNVAKKFLQLLDKHFPLGSKFHKIFNRNNTKVSYSCMPNMASIIRSHNQKVLNPQQKREERKCNCKVKETCPLEGNCLTEIWFTVPT